MKWDDILEQYREVNPDILGSAIISVQGLPLYSILPRDANEELISAMSAAILSMSEQAVKELDRGVLKRILIEGKDGLIILSKIGENVILCSLLRSEASSHFISPTPDNKREPPGKKDVVYVE